MRVCVCLIKTARLIIAAFDSTRIAQPDKRGIDRHSDNLAIYPFHSNSLKISSVSSHFIIRANLYACNITQRNTVHTCTLRTADLCRLVCLIRHISALPPICTLPHSIHTHTSLNYQQSATIIAKKNFTAGSCLVILPQKITLQINKKKKFEKVYRQWYQ